MHALRLRSVYDICKENCLHNRYGDQSRASCRSAFGTFGNVSSDRSALNLLARRKVDWRWNEGSKFKSNFANLFSRCFVLAQSRRFYEYVTRSMKCHAIFTTQWLAMAIAISSYVQKTRGFYSLYADFYSFSAGDVTALYARITHVLLNRWMVAVRYTQTLLIARDKIFLIWLTWVSIVSIFHAEIKTWKRNAEMRYE